MDGDGDGVIGGQSYSRSSNCSEKKKRRSVRRTFPKARVQQYLTPLIPYKLKLCSILTQPVFEALIFVRGRQLMVAISAVSRSSMVAAMMHGKQ
jgi:hypothetical protein